MWQLLKGSLLEAETQLLIAVRLGFVDNRKAGPALDLMHEIERMLSVLRTKLLGIVPPGKQRHA
jgi:four helix bundle protein